MANVNLGLDKLEKYQRTKPEVVKRLKQVNKLKVNKAIKNVNLKGVKQSVKQNLSSAKKPLKKVTNLLINKGKKLIPEGKGKLAGRVGNILSVASFFDEFNTRKEELIAKGYTPREARNRALTVELGGLAGEIGIGGTTTKAAFSLANLATVKSGGLAAVPAYGLAGYTSLQAYKKGEQIGEGGGKWLAKKLGMKVDQETLDKRLYQRQQKENYDSTLKAQAGGLN